MSVCINPDCPKYHQTQNDDNPFCQACGSNLLLNNRYEVIRLLSDKSGFGKIYEASESGSESGKEKKILILKVLKEDINESKVVELFQREAEALKRMNHPGIPKVDSYFEYQPKDGLTLHCIAMEKIDGLNLDEWLNQGNKLTEYEAIAWLMQLAEILDIVHQNNLIHRDIKPGNIMMKRSSGQLVLIDFGTVAANQKRGVTQVSSGGYTPREQASSAVPQSDFFALGRTFVHLLTGKHPLDMYDRNDVLNWRSHTSGISNWLLDFIDKLMAGEVADRPQTAQEILQESYKS
jgi:serine/threonine protein kinase